jgi:hypothetical protein
LLGGHGRRWGLLRLLRVGWGWWRRWLVGLGLLLVWCGRRWGLAYDRSLGEGDCGKSQQGQSGQRFVSLHTFVYTFVPSGFCALS